MMMTMMLAMNGEKVMMVMMTMAKMMAMMMLTMVALMLNDDADDLSLSLYIYSV